MSLSKFSAVCTVAALTVFATVTSTAQSEIIISEFLSGPAVPGDNQWYYKDMAAGGSATIVDLTGQGGNLEANQPLPVGAALLTTDDNNASRAQVGTTADFGDAATFLSTVELAYDYFKVASGNTFAAPSLKLELFAAGGTGDNYGQLIYEPSWNQPAPGSQNVPTGDWQAVSIDSSTGSGSDASGGWWWSGGFEIGGSAGGTPIRSLNEWVTAFQTSDATDFATARVIGIQMGVGTYNLDQIGYFDNVSYALPSGGETWNFEPVPEPSTIALLGLAGVAGLAIVRRRRQG